MHRTTRLATVLLVIPLAGLVLAFAMSPGPAHLHTDSARLTLVFGLGSQLPT